MYIKIQRTKQETKRGMIQTRLGPRREFDRRSKGEVEAKRISKIKILTPLREERVVEGSEIDSLEDNKPVGVNRVKSN